MQGSSIILLLLLCQLGSRLGTQAETTCAIPTEPTSTWHCSSTSLSKKTWPSNSGLKPSTSSTIASGQVPPEISELMDFWKSAVPISLVFCNSARSSSSSLQSQPDIQTRPPQQRRPAFFRAVSEIVWAITDCHPDTDCHPEAGVFCPPKDLCNRLGMHRSFAARDRAAQDDLLVLAKTGYGPDET